MAPLPVRARWSVSAQFFTNGVITASLLPRLPEVKASFALTDTAYGFLVVAMPAGSIAAATIAGPLIRRFGALRVAAIGTVSLAFLLAAAGFSPWAWMFALFMALAGFSDAILDSGQNVHGLAVERWYGKSIINSMHAAWSLGATAGGVIGAASAAAGLPLGQQLLAGAVLWSAVAVVSALGGAVPEHFLRPAEAHPAAPAPTTPTSPPAECKVPVPPSGRRFPWALFIPLALLAICGTLVEDIASNWVTLYLNREVGAGIGLAGMGFATMLAAQFVGRILGDPMTDRWGRAAVARFGGARHRGGRARCRARAVAVARHRRIRSSGIRQRHPGPGRLRRFGLTSRRSPRHGGGHARMVDAAGVPLHVPGGRGHRGHHWAASGCGPPDRGGSHGHAHRPPEDRLDTPVGTRVLSYS